MNKALRWNEVWKHLGVGILLIETLACSPLGSFMESQVSDLQLTVDTLKGSLRDAQRSMAELRAEVETRSQELAEVQIARAQLEGRVREAERRLNEARHVIELQREELASSRAERERATRTGAALQNQVKQLQRQLSKMRKQTTGSLSPATMNVPAREQSKSMMIRLEPPLVSEDPLEDSGGNSELSGPMFDTSVGRGSVIDRMATAPPHAHVLIKFGDTLWSIARRYHTSVHHLMTVNSLPNDYIQAGQSLWLTESAADEPEGEPR